MLAADTRRPAAIQQLLTLGEKAGIPVREGGDRVSPVRIAKEAVGAARKQANDVVIVDTAGRLHIDGEMMAELVEMKKEMLHCFDTEMFKEFIRFLGPYDPRNKQRRKADI